MLSWICLLKCSSAKFQRNVVRCDVQKAAVGVQGGNRIKQPLVGDSQSPSPSGAGKGVRVCVLVTFQARSMPSVLRLEALLSFAL